MSGLSGSSLLANLCSHGKFSEKGISNTVTLPLYSEVRSMWPVSKNSLFGLREAGIRTWRFLVCALGHSLLVTARTPITSSCTRVRLALRHASICTPPFLYSISSQIALTAWCICIFACTFIWYLWISGFSSETLSMVLLNIFLLSLFDCCWMLVARLMLAIICINSNWNLCISLKIALVSRASFLMFKQAVLIVWDVEAEGFVVLRLCRISQDFSIKSFAKAVYSSMSFLDKKMIELDFVCSLRNSIVLSRLTCSDSSSPSFLKSALFSVRLFNSFLMFSWNFDLLATAFDISNAFTWSSRLVSPNILSNCRLAFPEIARSARSLRTSWTLGISVSHLKGFGLFTIALANALATSVKSLGPASWNTSRNKRLNLPAKSTSPSLRRKLFIIPSSAFALYPASVWAKLADLANSSLILFPIETKDFLHRRCFLVSFPISSTVDGMDQNPSSLSIRLYSAVSGVKILVFGEKLKEVARRCTPSNTSLISQKGNGELPFAPVRQTRSPQPPRDIPKVFKTAVSWSM